MIAEWGVRRGSARGRRAVDRPVIRRAQSESARIAEILREETIGGALLLIAAFVALLWANSPWSAAYETVGETVVGPAFLHLDLTLSEWASEGLLTIFFFVAGLELKQEFVTGELRDRSRAAVPFAAALGGVVVPAAVYLATTAQVDDAARGWAIPSATDIAFALGVLAIISTHLPASLRGFLLTLAVVDDVLAISIIAVFYTESLNVGALLLSLVAVAAFTALVQSQVRSWWLLLPLALVAWTLMHSSGVHATVAGVLLGLSVPARAGENPPGNSQPSMAARFEHHWRPLSSGVAVPAFALLTAGVTIGGVEALSRAVTDPVALGIMLGLVVGKTVGVFLATYLVTRFSNARLAASLGWADLFGLSLLTGIGFTVALLIAQLAFGPETQRYDHAKIAILLGSVTAALLASVILRGRNRWHRRIGWETPPRKPDPSASR